MMTVIHLRAEGCSTLLDVTENRLPAVVHWGADLGALTEARATAVVLAARTHRAPNSLDEPVRLSLIPEHSSGWSGRPGLRGSRSGRAWSTRFDLRSVTVDGEAVDGFVEHGPGMLVVDAGDGEAALDLRVEGALLTSGLVRARATVTNRSDEFALEPAAVRIRATGLV